MNLPKQDKPALNSHSRFILTLIVNGFVPGLGNLIFVGVKPGNIICCMLSFWAITGHNQTVIVAWMAFMALKAAADIYLIPVGERKQLASHQQVSSKKINKQPDANNVTNLDASDYDPDHLHRSSHQESEHLSSSSRYDPDHLHSASHQDCDYLHSPVPYDPDHLHSASHQDAAHLSDHQDRDRMGDHHDSGQVQDSEGRYGSGHSPPVRQSYYPQEDEQQLSSHYFEESLPAGHVRQQKSAWSASSKIKNASHNEDQESVHDDHLPGLKPVEKLPHAELSHHHHHLVNQQQVVEAIVHAPAGDIDNDHSQLRNPHEEIDDLFHPENPVSHESCPPDEPADEAVVFDIYDETETNDPNAVHLCPTCQKPRAHNRPSCPACGTHYDQDAL